MGPRAMVQPRVVLLILALPLGGCATSIMDGIWGDRFASTAAASASAPASRPTWRPPPRGEAVAKLYNEGLESLKKNRLQDGGQGIRRGRTAVSLFELRHQGHPDAGLCELQGARNTMMRSWPPTASSRCILGTRMRPMPIISIALSDFKRINDTKRDQTATRKALEALEEVERRLPRHALCRRRQPEGAGGARPSRRQGNGRSAATTTSRAPIWPASTASSGW